MALGAKILAAVAALCIILWAAFLLSGAQPLTASNAFLVIYGEQEEFFSDAVVYQKLRNSSHYLLHLPRARPAYRWWSVDFGEPTISAVNAPGALGSRRYLLRGGHRGTSIDDRRALGEWYWHFTDAGASFAGNGFTCSLRRIRQ